MRKLSLIIFAALFGLVAYAQRPVQRLSLDAQPAGKGINVTNFRSMPLPFGKFQAPQKAAEDYPVITERPDGEQKTYLRAGDDYYVSGQSAYIGTQSGMMNIVFAEGNVVYLQNIVCTYTSGAWVKGTLSEDGSTITVELFQNLDYNANYDAPIVVCMGKVDGQSVSINKEPQEVTYTVADGTITLNGTDAENFLGAFWGDDDSWTGCGEWNTVLTEYTPDLTLVELPAGVEAVEMPLTGKYFPTLTYYQYGLSTDVEATVKVARDGDDIYVQGLVHSMPEAWVKGQMTDGTVVFPVTYLGSDDNGMNYISGYGETPTDVVMSYNAELDAYELDGYVFVLPNEAELNLNTIKGMYTGLYIGERPALVEVPEGLETVEMPFTGYVSDGRNSQELSTTVLVGIDGTDVYMQGLSDVVPTGWVKGSFNETMTQVVFPYGQYVGVSDDGGSVYLVGDDASMQSIDDIKMSYDEDANLYTLLNNLYSNGKADEFYYYDVIMAGAEIGINADVYVAAKQGYENAEDVTEIAIGEDAKGVLDQGEEGKNAPKYYSGGEALRMYAGNTLTITSEKVIGKVEFFFDKGNKQPQHQMLAANVGSYTLDGEALLGTWIGDEKEIVFYVPNESGNQARIKKIKIYYLDYATDMVNVPADLEPDTYQLVCKYETTEYVKDEDGNYVKDEDGNYVTETIVVDDAWKVKVAIVDGREVYMKGLSVAAPEGWVKGRLDAEGNVSFPGWYVGQYSHWYYGTYDLNYGGESMVYDAANEQFTASAYTIVSEGEPFEDYFDVVITKINDVPATPADPEIAQFTGGTYYSWVDYTIPTFGTNGESLLGDKLSYVFYVDDAETPLVLEAALYENLEEDMTEIPYTFTDDWDIYNNRLYLNQDVDEVHNWKKLGLQSIYRGGGEEHKSNIVWFDLEEYWVATGIAEVGNTEGQASYFDLQGRRIGGSQKGLVIKQVRDAQGRVKTVKMVRK